MDLNSNRPLCQTTCTGNVVSYLRRVITTRDTFDYQGLKWKFLNSCSNWKVYKTGSRFNRRITAIAWHPVYHDMVTFASHGGDIHLMDSGGSGMDACSNGGISDKDRFIEGEGFGYGSITQLAYDQADASHVYCSSVNGTVSRRDFEGRHSNVLIDTADIKYWWTTLTYCDTRGLLFTGGNTGKAVLMDKKGNKIKEYNKFHKEKIHYSELCPVNEDILVTSSNDRMVALWDLRYLDEKPRPLVTMKHNAPINSACFDPFFGSRILTTAQNSEIRVYESYNWAEPSLVIKHPHRHFQHMTNIKATWHPLYRDLCIIGRYPSSEDPDQSRCIDIIDITEGARGNIVGQFSDGSQSQIMVVNKFNRAGNILATGMGYTAVLWRLDKDELQLTRRRSGVTKINGLDIGRGAGNNDSSNGGRTRRSRRNEKRKLDDSNCASVRCTTKKKKLV